MATSYMSSKGIKWIGLGWTTFIAENLILSENREFLISNYGDDNYHLLYNSLSSLACGSIFYGYIKHRKTGPIIAIPGVQRKLLGFLFQNIGMMGISQIFPKLQSPYVENKSETLKPNQLPSTPTNGSNFKIRCPMDFKAPDVPADGIYGMERISRHPTFWSVGFLCLGRAVTSTYVPEIVMFTFPIVFASIGGWHQDQRYLRGSGGYLSQENYLSTSNIPFSALIKGKQSWLDLSKELKWSNICTALFLSSSFIMFKKI